MIAVAACSSHEQAEEVARRLSEEMRVRVRGDEVHVTRADYPRAAVILRGDGIEVQPLPFHPCPKCHTPDPIWFGKRKAAGMFLLVVLFMFSAFRGLDTLVVVSLVALIAFILGVEKIPEYECRNCHHRWLKEDS